MQNFACPLKEPGLSTPVGAHSTFKAKTLQACDQRRLVDPVPDHVVFSHIFWEIAPVMTSHTTQSRSQALKVPSLKEPPPEVRDTIEEVSKSAQRVVTQRILESEKHCIPSQHSSGAPAKFQVIRNVVKK
jgi:hypothetical protein